MTFVHQAACLRPSSDAEPTRPHLGPIGKTGCKNDNARDKSATGIAIGQGRSRTVDTAVFSRMLYRLSYLPALFLRYRTAVSLSSPSTRPPDFGRRPAAPSWPSSFCGNSTADLTSPHPRID